MTNESRRGVAGRPREQVQRNEKTQVPRVAARVLQLETVQQSSLENDLQRACGAWRTSGLQTKCYGSTCPLIQLSAKKITQIR